MGKGGSPSPNSIIMKLKKTISLIILIFFISTSLIYAVWPWVGGLACKASLRVVTSQGAKTVAAQAVASRALVETVLKSGLPAAGPKKIYWNVGHSAAALLGLAYLVKDFTSPLADLAQEPGLYIDTPATQGQWISNDGRYSVSWEIVDEHYYSAGSYIQYFKISFRTYPQGFITRNNAQGPGETKVRVNFTINVDGTQYTNSVAPCNRGVTFDIIPKESWGPGTLTDNSQKALDLNVFENWLDNNYDALNNAPTNLTFTRPQAATYAGSVQGTVTEELPVDPVTGIPTDPATGIEVPTVIPPETHTSMGIFKPPPHGGEPFFDMSLFVIPDQETYAEKMQDFTEEDPVGDFLEDFSIRGTGAGQVSIPLPFGGGHATMDFGMFDDIYAQLRVIIIAFAYLYGIFIFFKGS